MNGNSTRNVPVEGSGSGVVAHIGLHAIGSFADRLGLGDACGNGPQRQPGRWCWTPRSASFLPRWRRVTTTATIPALCNAR